LDDVSELAHFVGEDYVSLLCPTTFATVLACILEDMEILLPYFFYYCSISKYSGCAGVTVCIFNFYILEEEVFLAFFAQKF